MSGVLLNILVGIARNTDSANLGGEVIQLEAGIIDNIYKILINFRKFYDILCGENENPFTLHTHI